MSKAKKTEPLAKKSIVKPSILIEGDPHPLQKLEELGKLPELTAIGFTRLHDGKQHNWVSYVVKFQGDKVLSLEVDEPNMKGIAEEATKINFMNHLVGNHE